MNFSDMLKKEMNADEKKEKFLSDIRTSVCEIERGIKDIVVKKSKAGQFQNNNGKNIISGTFYLSQVDLDTCGGYIRKYLTHVPIIILNSKIKKEFFSGVTRAEYAVKLSEEMEIILSEVKKSLEKDRFIVSDYFIESKETSNKQTAISYCNKGYRGTLSSLY